MSLATRPDEEIPVLDEFPGPGEDGTTRRWLVLWVTLAIVAVGVVIGLLFPISGSLRSIDHGLTEASQAVKSVNGNVNPLPAYIGRINTNLKRVDAAVTPLPAQAGRVTRNLKSIEGNLVATHGSLVTTSNLLGHTSGKLKGVNGYLGGINGTLGDVNGTLKGTSGTLGRTEGSLRSISGTLGGIVSRLTTTRSLAGHIHHRLVLADTVKSSGAGKIWRNVRFLNGGRLLRSQPPNQNGLSAILSTAGGILGALKNVNGHLASVCDAPLLKTLGTVLGPGLLQPVPCNGGS